MQYFTIFQDKLHSVNIQDDQSWALSETVQKFLKSPIRPAGSHFYSASWSSVWMNFIRVTLQHNSEFIAIIIFFVI